MQKTALRLIMSVVALTMVVSAFVGCATTPKENDELNVQVNKQEKETVIMGTNAEFPPFEFIGDDGEVDGFDAALVKEIAKRIDAEVKIENMEFKSLIGSLGTGKIDLAAAGMTVTDERKQEVDFSQTYFTATQMIIVPVGSEIKDSKGLKGKTVGVQEGTTGDLIVSEEEYAAKEVKRYKKGIDAVMDLINGRVDAVVIDSNPSKEYVKANEGKIIALESGMEPEEYAIAVKKGNTELLEKINQAITEIKQDGTYETLVKQYIK